jgi:hypothetical protein
LPSHFSLIAIGATVRANYNRKAAEAQRRKENSNAKQPVILKLPACRFIIFAAQRLCAFAIMMFFPKRQLRNGISFLGQTTTAKQVRRRGAKKTATQNSLSY